MIVFTLSNTSAPFRMTLECELNGAVVQRTTFSVFIYHFYLYQCHIGTVRMEAFGFCIVVSFSLAGSPTVLTA